MEVDSTSDRPNIRPVFFELLHDYIETYPFWCQIHYYEYDRRVGEVYYATQRDAYVNGFTATDRPDTFSLGAFGNIHRNQEARVVRTRIGHGVRLYYLDGDVYLYNFCDRPVFIQSATMNISNNVYPWYVDRVDKDFIQKIFSSQHFVEQLQQSIALGYEAVFEMIRICTIRVSFVKGWGTAYRRRDASHTPCWIEIFLRGPLRHIDIVLNQLHPTEPPPSSRS